MLGRLEQPLRLERVEQVGRVGLAQARPLAAVRQRQGAGEQLDVGHAPRAALDAPRAGRLHLSPPHGRELVPQLGAVAPLVQERRQLAHQRDARLGRSRHQARLLQRQALEVARRLAQGAAAVVGQRRVAPDRERRLAPARAQAQVERQQRPLDRGRALAEGDHPPRHLAPQLGGRRPVGGGVLPLVDQHEVEVAGVGQLPPAQLPDRQHVQRAAGRPAASLARDRRRDVPDERAQEALGQVGQRAGRVLDVRPACEVGDPDQQQVERAQLAQRRGRGRLERGRHLGLDLLERDRRAGEQPVDDLVEDAGVRRQDVDQHVAPGREADEEVEGVGVLGHELEHRRLGAERRGGALEVAQRAVGVGPRRDRLQQPREQPRQRRARAPRGRQERAVLAHHALEVAPGGRGVEEPEPGEHRLGHLGARLAQEQVAHLELTGGGGAALRQERRPHQRVEHAPGAGARARVGGFEPGEVEPERARQGRGGLAARQPRDLAVHRQLQQVLEAPQQLVRLEERVGLRGAQVALAQPRDRLDRARRAQRRVAPPVLQLQELRRVLHVADPARADLDVALGVLHARAHALAQPQHVVDRLRVEPLSPQERRQQPEQLLAHGAVARRGAGLEQRLPLPGPPGLVVVGRGRRGARREGAARAVGAQAQVDAEQAPARRALLHRRDEGARQRLGGLRRRAVAAHEHEVDVARVVELAPAQLAERQHRQRQRGRLGEPPRDLRTDQRQRPVEQRVGEGR